MEVTGYVVDRVRGGALVRNGSQSAVPATRAAHRVMTARLLYDAAVSSGNAAPASVEDSAVRVLGCAVRAGRRGAAGEFGGGLAGLAVETGPAGAAAGGGVAAGAVCPAGGAAGYDLQRLAPPSAPFTSAQRVEDRGENLRHVGLIKGRPT